MPRKKSVSINPAILPFLYLCTLILVSSCSRESSSGKPFRIVVISNNNSLAYSEEVVLTDSLVQMTFNGGLVRERSRIIWRGPINRAFSDSFTSFLDREPWDSLKRFYSDSTIQDGMQFYFEIKYGNRADTAQLNNVWVPSLLKLTQLVNTTLPDSLKFNLHIPGKFSAP